MLQDLLLLLFRVTRTATLKYLLGPPSLRTGF